MWPTMSQEAMDATIENEEIEEESVSIDSEDAFQYKEVSVEDDWSLTEGEEDLEATVKAIRQRADLKEPTPEPVIGTVDDFLRNFLYQAGMTETLDCFQTEWTEMMQKSPLDAKLRGLVPSVYIENQRLDLELKSAKRERDEYQQSASAAAQTLLRLQRARDFHRIQYTRVLQEKTRLMEDMRRLKAKCDSYEAEVKRMEDKYQVISKQTMLAAAERDKLSVTHWTPSTPRRTQELECIEESY